MDTVENLITFTVNQIITPMPLMINAGALSVRRNTHMISLFLEYPTVDVDGDILAGLFNYRNESLDINLPVTVSKQVGVKFLFPEWLSGIFYLKIQAGSESILRRIAIQ